MNQSYNAHKSITGGFTLAEVLVSVLIFLILSGAMFGIFLSATNLYREGEFSRSSNDESQIVANLLEADIARAVPEHAGGIFYAWLDVHSSDSNHTSGNCVIGWVTRNERQNIDYPNPFVFVLWGLPHESNEPLRRTVLDINTDINRMNLNSLSWTNVGADDTAHTADDVNIGFNPNNPLPALGDSSIEANTITQGCLHFSASLTGTAHNINDNYVVCHKPSLNQSATNPLARTTYWAFVTDGNISVNDEPFSEPNTPGLYYANKQSFNILTVPYNTTYPNAIRISLVLSGNQQFGKEGRLRTELKANDTATISIAGIERMPSTPGSLLRIGQSHDTYEWIGYHDVDQQGLHINETWEDGPCMPGSSGTLSGRGVLKSTPKDHNVGATVRMGRLLTLTRTLPE